MTVNSGDIGRIGAGDGISYLGTKLLLVQRGATAMETGGLPIGAPAQWSEPDAYQFGGTGSEGGGGK